MVRVLPHWLTGRSGLRRTYAIDRDRDKVQPKPIPDTYCMGCNRPGHTREDRHHKNHPDFNRSGQWNGCRADRKFKARGKKGDEIKLTRVTSGVSAAPSPYRRNDTDDGAGADVTTIDAIEMEDVEDVEVERVVDMSTSLETQVRPVSLVASLT